MKDKLDEEFATFIMANYMILIVIGCIIGVSSLVCLNSLGNEDGFFH